MAHFLGQFEYVMDEKGRVSIPAKFREMLAQESDGTVSTIKGNDGCIFVFSPKGLDTFLAGFDRSQFKSEREARRFHRLIAQGGFSGQPDGQGRITLSEEERKHAGLKRDVVIFGNLERVEIWDPERLQKHLAGEDDETDLIDDLASKYLR